MKKLLHLPRDGMRQLRRAARDHFFPELVTQHGDLNLPPALVLHSICRASRGRRMKLLRRLIPYLPASAPAASVEVCEIDSLSEFESAYARLAVMLGQPGKTPSPGEINFLRGIVNRPMRYSGTISLSDYLFLSAFVSILDAQRVVEIGTLTGFSAAIIAGTLSGLSRERPRCVDTVDITSECFIDTTRPTGFEIAECFPELAATIRLHIPHDSSIVAELAHPDELDIVFIDANHQHPLPLLDLLRLAPFVRPQGWILLHDIQLGTIARRSNAADQICWGAAEGAEWLFQSWPWRKISGGNIGGVQLPPERSALIPFALRLMSMPFEIKGKGMQTSIRSALHRSFDALV